MSEKIYHQKRVSEICEDKYGDKRWITATARIASQNGQFPYFSLTAESGGFHLNGKRRGSDSFGTMHDDITNYVPELAKYIRWHLFDLRKGPMHYIANALYWVKEGNFVNFQETICFGPEEDYEEILSVYESKDEEKIKGFLLLRLPGLFEKFDADMEELFDGMKIER